MVVRGDHGLRGPGSEGQSRHFLRTPPLIGSNILARSQILNPPNSHPDRISCPRARASLPLPQVNRVRWLKRQEKRSCSTRRRRALRRWQVAVTNLAPQWHASPWCATRTRRVTSRATSPERSPSSGCRATAPTRPQRRRRRRFSSPRSRASILRKRLRYRTHTRTHGIEPALPGTHI